MIKQNLEWISNLRMVSTISVIIIHVVAWYAGDYHCNPDDPSWWHIGNIIDSIVRFCVPVFVMISGVLWFMDDSSAQEFYKKKMLRLIGPLIFWSLLTYLLNVFYLGTFPREADHLDRFYELFRNCEIGPHFWYVYMLLALVLIAPVFRTWIINVPAKDIRLYLLVWLISLFYFTPLFDDIRIAVHLRLFYNYTGYLVLGYYLTHHVPYPAQEQKKAGIVLFVLAVLFTIIGTAWLTIRNDSFAVIFYENFSLNIVVASAGIFLWLKNLNPAGGIFSKARNSISTHGYGIYLAHIFVLSFLMSFWNWKEVHPLVYVPALTLACLLITWLIIALLSRLPYSKYYIG